nr:transcriptional regulator [Deinococcus peraridilitoris]
MDNHSQAKQDVERARLAATVEDFLSVVRGVPNELIPFDWVKHLAPHGEHQLGVQSIPVDSVIGSVDRYRDFSRHFLPKEHFLDERWISVRKAQLGGRELPPIQVYKVGELYFVKDGNHRVSVARRNGQKYIDASIIELDVRVKPEPDDTLRDLIIKGEYARFLSLTRLDELAPHHRLIRFTTPGRYDIVLDHIRTRQYYLSLKHEREVGWEEAVESWHRRLYARVTEHIEQHHVMRFFPGRTEADLYLWIMDHRYFLKQRYGFDVGSELATLDFVRHFRPRAWKRVGTRLQLLLHGQKLHPTT